MSRIPSQAERARLRSILAEDGDASLTHTLADAAREHLPGLLDRLEELEAHIDRAVCSWCGFLSSKGNPDEINAHIFQCEKRPERKLLEYVAKLERVVEAVVEKDVALLTVALEALSQPPTGDTDSSMKTPGEGQ